MQTNQACLQCHEEFQKEHSHHRDGSPGSHCYNCHMPHTTYGLLKGIRSHRIDSPDVSATLRTDRPNACNQCHLDRTLAWSANYLEKWYQISAPEILEEQRNVAASVLDILKGAAAKRALAAWTMGWEPARQASGSDWLNWHRTKPVRSSGEAFLFDVREKLQQDRFRSLLQQRDDQPVSLVE